MRLQILGASALALMSYGAPAMAQAVAAKDTTLEEIVVTANKREERLQDVAAAISVVSGASLERSGDVQFTQYFDKIPGLSAVSLGTPGKAVVSIRGISTGASQTGPCWNARSSHG